MEHRLLEEKILYLEKQLMTYDYNELNEHLAEDFLEYGSSGNIFDKNAQLEAVREGKTVTNSIRYTVTDFNIKVLAPGVVLATYHTLRHNDQQLANRSSIWKEIEGKWQMIFHQGTPTK
jgi:hypothetical protein